MLRHLTECAECRAAVARLEHGVAFFRKRAVEWSSECLAARPQQLQFVSVRRLPASPLRWAIAAVPMVLLVLALLRPLSRLPQPAAGTSGGANQR